MVASASVDFVKTTKWVHEALATLFATAVVTVPTATSPSWDFPAPANGTSLGPNVDAYEAWCGLVARLERLPANVTEAVLGDEDYPKLVRRSRQVRMDNLRYEYNLIDTRFLISDSRPNFHGTSNILERTARG